MKITKEIKRQAIRPFFNETGIYDIRDIKGKTKGFFFSKDAMRFFNSRLVNEVFPSKGKVYFVTSEKFDYKSPRLFTVRVYDVETKSIETVGEFQGYETRVQAMASALSYAYDMLESVVR